MLTTGHYIALGGVIGGVVGSTAIAVVNHYLQSKREIVINRKNVVDKYLVQLQDAVEDLMERLEVPLPKEIPDESRNYYFVTLLYALGRIFAYKRIFVVDGVLSQMDTVKKGLGNDIKKRLDDIDEKLRQIDIQDQQRDFRYYDNIALGELVVDSSGNHLKTITYKDFRKKIEEEKSVIGDSVSRLRNFAEDLREHQSHKLEQMLDDFLKMLSKETSIEMPIRKKKHSKQDYV